MLLTFHCSQGRLLLQGHFSAVTSLAFTPNGWGLLSAGRDKTVMLWDLRSYKQVATIPVYEAVEGVPAAQSSIMLHIRLNSESGALEHQAKD